jgi:hypothetical protein
VVVSLAPDPFSVPEVQCAELIRNVGLYGSGVSATVRSAYAFLAHNYDIGDEIFFFGFSRGAYIARSIAGLVTSLGLLTKKGMDHFPLVYQRYYDHEAHTTTTGLESKSFEVAHADFVDGLKQKGLLAQSAQNAVKIVGVWDTVGFHAAGLFEEKIEFRNCELSPRVENAYHALALDERREPFRPTVWRVPSKESIDAAFPPSTGGRPFVQDMQQVWFSGRHSDIGGGLDDPRLSDITLAWMIAQCAKKGKLAFTDLDTPDDYLIDSVKTPKALTDEEAVPWATAQGQANEPPWYEKAYRAFISADRKPLIYMDEERRDVEADQATTNEYIHRSIRDRNLDGKGKGEEWKANALAGGNRDGKTGGYVLARDARKSLLVAPKVERDVVGADGKVEKQDVEAYFRGRVVKIMSADAGSESVGEVERELEGMRME